MSWIPEVQPEIIDWSAPINWDHSLARGLVFCTLPGMPQYEQVSKRNGTRLTNGNFVGKSQFGKSLASTVSTTTGGASFPWSEKIGTISVDFTILVLANVTTLSSYGVLFSVPYRSAGFTAPYVALCLQRDASTSGMQAGYSHSTGPTQDAVQSDTGLLATSNGMTMYGFTRQGTTGIFYRNGIQHGASKTFAGTNTVDWTNKRPPVLFNQSSTSGGSSMIGQIPFCGIYNRCLTAVEMQNISDDVFAFVRRLTPFQYVPAGGGGATAFPWHYYQQLMAG